MPRLKLSASDSRNTRFRAAVQHQMILYGIESLTDLARRCGIPHTTFYRRLKDTDTLTNGELRKIYNVLHFTDEQRLILSK